MILLSGMVFLSAEISNSVLKHTWKFLAPAAAGFILWTTYQDRRAAVRSGEIAENRAWFLFADFGVLFLTLEDETGNSNIVVWKRTQEQFRQVLMSARVLLVNGTLETKDNVTHIIAGALYDHTDELDNLRLQSRDFR